MDPQSQNSTTTSSIPGTGIWGTILKSKGGPYDVRMTDDTGTPVNWIHPDLIKRCKLDREICQTEMFKDFHGKPFKVKEYVWFTWVGRLDDKTYAGVFYPAPRESEIDVLLGDEFVKTNGRAQDVCAPERRLKDMRLFAQSSMSASVPLNHKLNLRTSSMLMCQQKQEKKDIQANKEEHDRQAAELSKRINGTPKKSDNKKNDKRHGSSSHQKGK